MSMGKSKLALGLVLFTVLVSSALAQGKRPEEAFQQCQQKCQSQSQYGRGQMGQYECQMRCVRELERETGRGGHYGGQGDRDIDIDVNQFPGIDSQCLDQCRGQAARQMTECVVRCALQQGQQGQRGQQGPGQQRDNKQWGPEQGGSSSARGGYGEDYERYDECLQKCSHQQGRQGEYQQQECMSQCLQRHQQGRQGAMDTNESRRPYGGRGSHEKFGQCVARCSEQHGSQQSECLLRCQQQQDNQEWDPKHGGQGHHGGQGYERYGECMQRCSRQPGQQQQYCTKQCQKQQQKGYYPGQTSLDNHHKSKKSDSKHKEYSYECIQRCEKRGEDPYECQKICIQGKGRHGGDSNTSGLASILKFTAGLFN